MKNACQSVCHARLIHAANNDDSSRLVRVNTRTAVIKTRIIIIFIVAVIQAPKAAKILILR